MATRSMAAHQLSTQHPGPQGRQSSTCAEVTAEGNGSQRPSDTATAAPREGSDTEMDTPPESSQSPPAVEMNIEGDIATGDGNMPPYDTAIYIFDTTFFFHFCKIKDRVSCLQNGIEPNPHPDKPGIRYRFFGEMEHNSEGALQFTLHQRDITSPQRNFCCNICDRTFVLLPFHSWRDAVYEQPQKFVTMKAVRAVCDVADGFGRTRWLGEYLDSVLRREDNQHLRHDLDVRVSENLAMADRLGMRSLRRDQLLCLSGNFEAISIPHRRFLRRTLSHRDFELVQHLHRFGRYRMASLRNIALVFYQNFRAEAKLRPALGLSGHECVQNLLSLLIRPYRCRAVPPHVISETDWLWKVREALIAVGTKMLPPLRNQSLQRQHAWVLRKFSAYYGTGLQLFPHYNPPFLTRGVLRDDLELDYS
ncbi:uncharacterized protein BJX67DRAFT_189197 [Aspergillus lucknowensis]|uniref:Uncharacterized protein n=1 Tax=Aspergillus lucknowensis TaxID=176173 RepID=A0ABR4LKX0_9EURO